MKWEEFWYNYLQHFLSPVIAQWGFDKEHCRISVILVVILEVWSLKVGMGYVAPSKKHTHTPSHGYTGLHHEMSTSCEDVINT